MKKFFLYFGRGMGGGICDGRDNIGGGGPSS
jgi:hypothetical protein